MKKNILFLCTGNSCRSQMAEGWAKHLLGDKHNFFSAGVETHGLNPNAVQVMNEMGVDISGHQSQHIDEYQSTQLDLVMTVCDHASESCPILPRETELIHHSFSDPPKMAQEFDEDEQKLNCYRQVRDQIKEYIETELVELL